MYHRSVVKRVTIRMEPMGIKFVILEVTDEERDEFILAGKRLMAAITQVLTI
ncbi:MAG: hypothetical protein ABI684_10520 [Nitrospirota bacterium]